MGSSDGGCEQPRVQTKTFLRESVSRFLLALFIYISETGEKYADSDWSVLIRGDCVVKFWRCWVQLKLLIRHLLLGLEPIFGKVLRFVRNATFGIWYDVSANV